MVFKNELDFPKSQGGKSFQEGGTRHRTSVQQKAVNYRYKKIFQLNKSRWVIAATLESYDNQKSLNGPRIHIQPANQCSRPCARPKR